MFKNLFLILVVVAFTAVNSFAQDLSFGGQVGWASPKGKSFVDEQGDKMAGGGLSFDLDAMYHFNSFDNKLGVGLTLNSSVLFGVSKNDGMDVGLYGLSLYGAKGSYRFFSSAVSPYVSLSTGLSQFSTPEITDANGAVLAKGDKSYSFGLRPELGIDLGGFIISAGYFVPMKYSITDKSAGTFQISMGYRYRTF